VAGGLGQKVQKHALTYVAVPTQWVVDVTGLVARCDRSLAIAKVAVSAIYAARRLT